MKRSFKKMMREQVQTELNDLNGLAQKPPPGSGWIQTIREALGISSHQLAKRMGCTQSNVMAFERREKAGTISLEALNQTAKAMNCRLVYFLVPNKAIDELLKDQARLVAKARLHAIGHSMELEQQGLTPQQRKQQEDDLVQELLQGSLRNLWKNDDEI